MNKALPKPQVRRDAGLAGAILAAVLLASVSRATAAQTPAWLTPLLSAPAPAANLESSAVMLLDESRFQLLPGGKVRETDRQVTRIVTSNTNNVFLSGSAYNANTDHILKAQAWVVSPDGHKTEAYGRSNFLDVVAEANNNYWHSGRVICFVPTEKLQVGGVAAVELDIERETGFVGTSWQFRKWHPVGRSHFEVVPLPGQELAYHASSTLIPAPVHGSTPGSLSWEMQNIAVLPSNLPDGFIPNPLTVMVRSQTSGSRADAIPTWEQIAGRAAGIIEPRMLAAPAVVLQANAVLKGKVTRWERIRALCEYVQKRISYLSVTLDKDSLADMRPQPPENVLRSQLGDCKDKSALLATMLRSAGEKACAILVFFGNPRAVEPTWPSLVFNHVVVGIAANGDIPARWPVVDGGALGRLVLFDPTDPDTPLGALPQGDQGGFGLIVSEDSRELVALPTEDPEVGGLTRHLTGELSADGQLKADVEERLVGWSSGSTHGARVKMGAEKFRQQLENTLHAFLQRLSDLSWTEEWDAAEASSQLAYHFRADHVFRSVGSDAVLLSPRLVGGDFHYDLWRTDCEGVVWLQAKGVTEEDRLLLPEGFVAESLPSDWHQELPGFRAMVAYRLEGRTLIFTRRIYRHACLLGKTDHDAIYHLSQKLEEAERRPVILRRAPRPTSLNPPASS